MKTKVRTFSYGIHSPEGAAIIGGVKGGSSRLFEIAEQADEAVALLGGVEIVEIRDAIYRPFDNDYPMFFRRVVYKTQMRSRSR